MKVLVVDDEPLARQRLLRLCAELESVSAVVEAANGEQALQQCSSEEPDLILLDIQMPGANGLVVANEINRLEPAPAIIFCTAYDDFALQAIERQAAAYLLKPVKREELQRAIDAACRSNRLQLGALKEPRRQHLASGTGGSLDLVPIDQVRCFIADQKSVKAYLPDREIWVEESLKAIAGQFPDRFIRIHRNALVAADYVRGLQAEGDAGFSVRLEGVDICPSVSRRHLSTVRRQLKGL